MEPLVEAFAKAMEPYSHTKADFRANVTPICETDECGKHTQQGTLIALTILVSDTDELKDCCVETMQSEIHQYLEEAMLISEHERSEGKGHIH